MLFLNLVMAVYGSFAGVGIYVAIVGFENREPEWMVASAIGGALVNRGLTELHHWLAKKTTPTQE